jgi:hypothetical protein
MFSKTRSSIFLSQLRRQFSTQPIAPQVNDLINKLEAELYIHPATNPALYDWIKKQTGLSAEQFDILSKNFATRQGLTNAVIAQLLVRTNHGQHHFATRELANTAAEEFGASPDETAKFNPHSELLQQSLNAIRKQVFGLPNFDVQRVTRLLNLLHDAESVLVAEKFGQDPLSFFDILVAANFLRADTFNGKKDIEDVRNKSLDELDDIGILPETISYSNFIHDLLRKGSVADLVAVLVPLEIFGTPMMGFLEDLTKKYQNHFTPEEYKIVDLYFAVHREGTGVNKESAVANIVAGLDEDHVARILDVMKDVVKTLEQVVQTSDTAREFAKRQLEVFNGILKVIENDKSPIVEPLTEQKPGNHINANALVKVQPLSNEL